MIIDGGEVDLSCFGDIADGNAIETLLCKELLCDIEDAGLGFAAAGHTNVSNNRLNRLRRQVESCSGLPPDRSLPQPVGGDGRLALGRNRRGRADGFLATPVLVVATVLSREE